MWSIGARQNVWTPLDWFSTVIALRRTDRGFCVAETAFDVFVDGTWATVDFYTRIPVRMLISWSADTFVCGTKSGGGGTFCQALIIRDTGYRDALSCLGRGDKALDDW